MVFKHKSWVVSFLLGLSGFYLSGCDVTGNSALDLSSENTSIISSSGETSILGEVWVDNWFAMYLDGRKVFEDTEPFTKERSFNAERFNFKANLPVTIGFEFRDFMQNETGLEYIGTVAQQMGDGGAIFQFANIANKQIIAVSNARTKCLVVQTAPINAECAKQAQPLSNTPICAQLTSEVPDNWSSPGFDDRAWENATPYPATAIEPKDGYDRIKWNENAQFIWSGDLVKDNILLCRMTIGG